MYFSEAPPSHSVSEKKFHTLTDSESIVQHVTTRTVNVKALQRFFSIKLVLVSISAVFYTVQFVLQDLNQSVCCIIRSKTVALVWFFR